MTYKKVLVDSYFISFCSLYIFNFYIDIRIFSH
jgi:hypothetical protein